MAVWFGVQDEKPMVASGNSILLLLESVCTCKKARLGCLLPLCCLSALSALSAAFDTLGTLLLVVPFRQPLLRAPLQAPPPFAPLGARLPPARQPSWRELQPPALLAPLAAASPLPARLLVKKRMMESTVSSLESNLTTSLLSFVALEFDLSTSTKKCLASKSETLRGRRACEV